MICTIVMKREFHRMSYILKRHSFYPCHPYFNASCTKPNQSNLPVPVSSISHLFNNQQSRYPILYPIPGTGDDGR